MQAERGRLSSLRCMFREMRPVFSLRIASPCQASAGYGNLFASVLAAQPLFEFNQQVADQRDARTRSIITCAACDHFIRRQCMPLFRCIIRHMQPAIGAACTYRCNNLPEARKGVTVLAPMPGYPVPKRCRAFIAEVYVDQAQCCGRER